MRPLRFRPLGRDAGAGRSVVRLARLSRAATLAVALAGGAVACDMTPPARSSLSYTADAKRAYDAAMEDFRAKNWIEAQQAFRDLKRKYGYAQKYVRLAELRLADADFEQEKYAEAIRGYKQFVHDHRTDPEEVEYARSKMAEAQFREISESFLLPTVEERDQAAAVEAFNELRSFLQDYPDGRDSRRICDLLEDVTKKLVRHELYVARFYLARDNFEGAVARLQYALRNYVGTSCSLASLRGAKVAAKAKSLPVDPLAPPPVAPPGAPGAPDDASGLEFGLAPDTLLLLGETYLKMRRYPEARAAFNAIVDSYSSSALIVPARRYLDLMKERGV